MIKKTLVTGALALLTLISTVFSASAAGPGLPAGAPVNASTAITAEEAASLQFMREEEKLAHDVYVALAEAWGLRVFGNIAQAEQQHSNATAYWLDYYKLDDPAEGNAPGKFMNADLQALYDNLVAQGKRSVADALKVGAAIEEIDIRDLDAALSESSNPALTQLYGNLKAGSENHLRAFASNLRTQTGETYAPQYLSQAAYDEMVGGASQGNRSGRYGGRNGRRP